MGLALRAASPETSPQNPGFERLLGPLGAVINALLGSRGCLVAFHRAARSEVWESLPNRGFQLDLAFLDRLLTYLKQNGWAIVTIEEALQRTARGDGDRFVNFSIDDAYRDTFEEVVPLFRRHGVPVTIYVTTGIPDGTLPLWAAGLEEALCTREIIHLPAGPLGIASQADKDAAFARIASEWDGPQAGDCYASFCRLNDIDIEAMHWKHAMSWDMLKALRNDPLVEIGAHTVSHARISSMPTDAAFAEIKGCRDRLIEKLGIDLKHFAFPYGRSGDCGTRDFALTREAGFSSAATTRKGLLRKGQDAYSLPRNTLNGAHRNLLMAEAHLTGLSGLATKVLGCG